VDKYQLSERDICTKFITPAIQQSGWQQHQFREEVKLTDGRVMVRGKLAARIRNPKPRVAPSVQISYSTHGPTLPIAVVEAKQARFAVGHGMQQALGLCRDAGCAFAISSNGDGFLLHDRTGLTQPIERELQLGEFPLAGRTVAAVPAVERLGRARSRQARRATFLRRRQWQGASLLPARGHQPRHRGHCQGQQRVLLVMATGTGKTYTAFQIIWRLWKAKAKQRILFLADRNILVDQTMQQDFAPFGEVMHKVTNRKSRRTMRSISRSIRP
jgi:type I restriction enzyme R subunit